MIVIINIICLFRISDDDESAVSVVARENEFWDYDNQIDLEAFSSQQLYTQLANQSHRVVATIGGQKEQVDVN